MRRVCFLLLAVLLLAGCGQQTAGQTAQTTESTQAQEAAYMNITQEEAKKLMDTEENYIILDVRELDEYEEKHIPGALLLPVGQIEELAGEKLPNRDQLILVYCRSGNRSKTASEALEKLGYTRIREFGGIKDWPYETESIR